MKEPSGQSDRTSLGQHAQRLRLIQMRRCDQRAGIAIVDDIGRLCGWQIAVDGRQIEAGAHASGNDIEKTEAVFEIQRDMVATPEAPVVQQLRKLVRPVFQRPERSDLAGCGPDRRGLVGMGAGEGG